MQYTVHAVILNHKKQVFMIKRTDFPIWTLPGGHVEMDESPSRAITREIAEETSLSVKLNSSPIIYHVMNNVNAICKLEYLYIGTFNSGTYIPEFPGNQGEWFSLSKLPKSVSASMRNKIRDSQDYKSQNRNPILCKRHIVRENIGIIILHPWFILSNLTRLSKLTKKIRND